jgi:hypothetical protein
LLGALTHGTQKSFYHIFKNAQSSSRNGSSLPSIIDNTAGDFIFIYNEKFMHHVDEIRVEILANEDTSSANVWSADWWKENMAKLWNHVTGKVWIYKNEK